MKTSFSTLVVVMLLIFSFINTSNSQTSEALDDMFYNYSVQELNSKHFHDLSRSGDFMNISLPRPDGGVWNLELVNSEILSDDYKSIYVDELGRHEVQSTMARPMQGYIEGDYSTSVSLTFNDGFIYGFIKDTEGSYYIEPVSHFDKNLKRDNYVIYSVDDLRPTAPKKCGVTETKQNTPNVKKSTESGLRVDECFEVEWAIANDFLMFENFGSVFAVEDHAIGVANNVQTNYDDEFEDELQFIISGQFTATTEADDPWTTSTDAGELLDEFRDWGNDGNFGLVFDVASLWTDRNFDGATIGGAVALAIGIGLQNFPEGFAVAMPLRRQGLTRRKSFMYGQASALVEPIAAVIGAWAVLTFQPILPYALSFAAGAMIFVVVEEVIPETQQDKHSDIAVMGFIGGFIVMMTLDVGLG